MLTALSSVLDSPQLQNSCTSQIHPPKRQKRKIFPSAGLITALNSQRKSCFTRVHTSQKNVFWDLANAANAAFQQNEIAQEEEGDV